MQFKDKVAELRSKTTIAWCWQYLGLPDKAGRICKSPFRKDNNASFSVWDTKTGQKFKDHGTGETGDVIDFWAKAKGVSVGVAVVELLSLRNMTSPPPVQSYPLKRDNGSSDWRRPAEEECKTLATLRGLDAHTFDFAGHLGTLRVGIHPTSKELLWWFTDKTRRASEGRRFDGKPCEATGKKVACLPGSKKDFPVGLKTSNSEYDRLTTIMMVEGSADYFAAIHMALRTGINFRVCSMLGASCNICHEAALLFKRTNVVIMAHNDESGKAAACRWKEQLTQASHVIVQPLPDEIKDLNDLMRTPLFSFKPLTV